MKITSKETLIKSFKRQITSLLYGVVCADPGSVGILPAKKRAGRSRSQEKRINQRFPDFSSFLRLVLLALALLPAAAAAEEAAVNNLGRLFYTPEQRLQIDRLKNRPGQAGTTIGNTISVNGIVQRKGAGSGGSVVWINGVPQSHESADGLLAGRNIAPDAASVKVPGINKSVRLKVGQSIDLDSGTVRNIGVAPATAKDAPAGENEQARQADSPAQSRVKPAPDGKAE